MLWVWLFNILIWMVKLPFYLLPGSDFLPIPAVITDAVEQLGEYTHWVMYLLGTHAGDAFTNIITWLTPVFIAIFLWKLLMRLGLFSVTLIRGGGGNAGVK